MYDDDPNGLNRPRLGDPVESSVAPRTALGVLVALAIAALLFAFWPRGDTTQVTENMPAYRAPATTPVTPTSPKPPVPQ
jgi:multidrug resistance efflux pump